MKDDQVLRPAGREHVPGSAHPLPPRAVAWPQWREDHPVNSPSGHAYVLAALRMTVPSGRSWQQHRLVENDALRTRLAPLFGALPMSHSLLQEPHGGQHCRHSADGPRIWHDTDPDRWPNTLYRTLAEADGPRSGLGEITVRLRLTARDGALGTAERVIAECNVRSDGRLLLTQVPDRLPPLS
ncbi:hypothetical protein ACWGRF_13055 [Streptomyces zhihengii]